MKITPPGERFLAKVDKTTNANGCWLWQGALNNHGYGYFQTPGNRHTYTHRFAYEQFKGPIPEGLSLDHLCRTPRCCNPEHLEPVTHKQNMERSIKALQTHCVNGHLFDEKNTYYRPDNGCRSCKECGLIRKKAKNA